MTATTRPDLLFLPGLLCDAEVWAGQTGPLAAAGWRCTVVEHGLADAIDTMAAQALAQADAAGLGRLAVVGHSMGGRVAMALWRLAPQRVAGLALLDTAAHPLPPGEAGVAERAGRERLLQMGREQGMAAMARDWARGMVAPAFLDGPLFAQVVAMIARRTPAHHAAQIQALLKRPDAAPTLRSVTVPSLLLCGEHDAWSPASRHAEMQALIQEGGGTTALTVVPGAGHMAPMESPEAVTRALQDWLALLT
ncbi:alpha/beta fold hydrolase [Ideonella livida]|uniref:Alpha/beta hydrolase n=1 Tax=Ideonella livida TaxID=2707176 RepID=A0A7C9TLE6_9BURK|nr:alpha/beta hydrolase [Ideonella livida]NDY92542.1 alpha/beta hydrolase [Ideonella livida]